MSRRSSYSRPDHRTQAAKAQGYVARSVFKLSEIDERLRLLKRGQRVLDLGAAPGSWSQYASERIGSEGRVLAVDLQPLSEQVGHNVTCLQADALELDDEQLQRLGPYDVVLSDMAPPTSGSKIRDQARSAELFERALSVGLQLGAVGSSFVGKLFMSNEFATAKRTLAAHYERVQVIRPRGTRKVSSEVFLVGMGLRDQAAE